MNELSCRYTLREEAIGTTMGEFVSALKAIEPRPVLVSPLKLPHIELAHGYPMARWMARDKDRGRWLLRLQDRAPYSFAELADDQDDDLEYRFDGAIAEGIGLAHSHDGLAVSLPSGQHWTTTSLAVDRTSIDESVGDLTVDTVQVRHLSTADHVAAHKAWLGELAFGATISTGAELWTRREELFPALTFLPRVADHLVDLDPKWVHAVTVRLRECQEMVVEWRGCDAIGPRYRSLVTPEHTTRRRETHFEDLDGVVRDFGTHLRFTPDAGRLHLREVPEERTIRIAHIGLKIGI
ncbi:hypothetical protein [Nocardia sp. NPDC058497]|uniref:hypothetical protein n=1 Tax=Nocardia sp. NPDC058497 TaxID=3346529 RepID=UPI003648C1EB